MNNEEKILQMLEKLTEDVSGLKEDVSGLKEDVSNLKTSVSQLEEGFTGLRADVDLLKEDQANMRETLTRVAVTQENLVLPRLQILLEGQAALQATLAPKDKTESRLNTLESDVSTLKAAVHTHADRLVQLEKAQ